MAVVDEPVVRGDLWKTVEWPQAYRLSTIPRSISWDDVGRVLATADRRTPCGKRDYALLLLLATYGLRSREVAALTLDDIDWRTGRRVRGRGAHRHAGAGPVAAIQPQLDEFRVEVAERPGLLEIFRRSAIGPLLSIVRISSVAETVVSGNELGTSLDIDPAPDRLGDAGVAALLDVGGRRIG